MVQHVMKAQADVQVETAYQNVQQSWTAMTMMHAQQMDAMLMEYAHMKQENALTTTTYAHKMDATQIRDAHTHQ